MDEAVGLVLDALDRCDIADNTIVCFTSDNGGVSSGDSYSTSNLPLRGGKGRQWEGGIRVPFHIKAPGVTKPATTCDISVSGIDFYPTLLKLAGIPIPEEQKIDGMDLTPLLEGNSDKKIEERDLFWHYPHYGNQGGEPSSIIRSGSWKLIHYYEDGRDELYNLETDPMEQNDISTEEPDKSSELREKLDAWLSDVNAKMPIPDPEYDPQKR